MAYSFADVSELAGDKPLRVLAKISVLRTEDGGRQSAFRAPYRPNHNFGDANNRVFYIGQVEVPPGESVQPGEVVELMVTFVNARGLLEELIVGRTWRIQEGPKLVATAEVLALLSPG